MVRRVGFWKLKQRTKSATARLGIAVTSPNSSSSNNRAVLINSTYDVEHRY